MKKKTIEKIPFLGLPETNQNADVKYIGVTKLKNIAHERHLFLEIYRNDEEAKGVPVARIVFTKKDFGTYFPESGTWSRGNIRSNEYYASLIWETKNTDYKKRVKQNVLYDGEDLKRINSFFHVVKQRQHVSWWENVGRAQEEIVYRERNERSHRKWEKRKQALQDRIDHTPELPEQEILSWADRVLFHDKHHLFYKKKGRRATICCSACGGVKEGVWKDGYTYESMFESRIGDPRNKYMGICPLCGASGVYKSQGTVKNTDYSEAYTFKADRYKETGVVIRYIKIEKSWILEESIDDKGEPVMMGALEKLEGVEIARTYFYNGKSQTDFQKYDGIRGKDFWDDCNLYGMNSIRVEASHLYPGFFEALKGTDLQYSGIELYQAAVGKVNARDYLERYIQTPQIEMLVKMKLYGVVDKLLHYNYGIIRDVESSRPDKFLGIRKEKVKFLMKKQGDARILFVLQMEKRLEKKWTDEQVEALEEIEAMQIDVERVLRIMTLQKALNQIAKYAGCEYGTGCGTAMSRLKHVARTYFDYLSMREQLGYDLNNTVYQRPRSLENAHRKMVDEMDKKKADKRKQEVSEKYPLIRKNYRKLRNRYFYEDENYMIRPARSAEEIVMEGRTLHHCVGGDNYLKRHNDQESIILMLRYKDKPEIPYITVEIKEEHIVQWYGAHDKKPDEQNMQKWLDAYVMRLKCGQMGAVNAPEQDIVGRILMPA